MIAFNQISSTAYTQLRYDTLLAIEEQGTPKLLAYADSRGIPTIGIGFNLREPVVQVAVFARLGIVTPATQLALINIFGRNYAGLTPQLRTDLAMALGRNFEFVSSADVEAVFNDLADNRYEGEINRRIAGVPESRERIALFSLAWNNPSALLGPKLLGAIQSGDRAEAWYQIRYGSNAGALSFSNPPADANGIAKRRYFEAAIFSLYEDPGATQLSISEPEALSVYAMYSRNIHVILPYEALYDAQIVAANDHYGVSGTYVVQEIEEALAAAGHFLLDRYVSPFGSDPQTFNVLDIAVAEDVAGSSTRRLRGGSGRDLLIGQSGHDTLTGGSGDDVLVGGAGDDHLDGGPGDDVLQGGEGNDSYHFLSGDGVDTIVDPDGTAMVLWNGSKVAIGVKTPAGTWTYTSPQGATTIYTKIGSGNIADLEIEFLSSPGDKIILKDFDFTKAANDFYGLRLIDPPSAPTASTRTFVGDKQDWDSDPNEPDIQTQTDAFGNTIRADGQGDPARPDLEEADREDFFYGSDANEVERFLTAGGDDTVYADGAASPTSMQGGDDIVEAGAGSDVVAAGAGDDWIEGGTEADILAGNEGKDSLFAESSNAGALTIDLAITQGEAGDQRAGQGDLLSGDAGDDVLLADAGADFLAGGLGEEIIVGGAGDDTIYGDGTVTSAQRGWTVTRTRIDVGSTSTFNVSGAVLDWNEDDAIGNLDIIYGGAGADWIFAGAADDYVEGGIGDDVLFGEAGHDVLVGGAGNDVLTGDSASVDTAGLSGDDYLVGGDGDDELVGGKGNDYLEGGDGYDRIVGNEGDDTLVGNNGTDVLVGGAGKDTYIYNAGDGQTLIDDDPSGANDPEASVLVLGPGITPEDVKFRPNFLVVDLGDGNLIQFLHFDPEDPLSTPVLDAIEFQSGGYMTLENVLEQGFDLDGTEEDDVLFGTPYTDRIDAKGGNDTVSGRDGDDTILGGTGDDWLDGAGGNDVVDGSEGSDELRGGWGDDLLQGGEGDDALAGEGGNDTLQGGAGADSLVGQVGDDVLAGGTGDDLLIGNEGSDTYTFSAGDGLDQIDEQALIANGVADEAGIDVVRFDATVTPAQVTLARGGNGDLAIRYGAGDTVTVIGQYAGAGQAIERIEFDDGTVIDKAALDALSVAPIEGTAGDDTLSGTPGSDTIAGGAGADSYAMYLGMGRDTLADASPSAAEIGTLSLAQGLSLDSLKARRVGNNLAVDIRGTNDGVVIQGYFEAGSTQNWQIAEYGGATTAMQDLIDRPDPYADDAALGAREDYRQGLLAAWAAETVASPLPTHAWVAESWSQTTFTFLGDGTLQPYTEVLPPVTDLDVEGYGVKTGSYFSSTLPFHHSIDVVQTSQEADDGEIYAQNQSQSNSQTVTYGVTPGNIIPGYGAQSTSYTSTFATGVNSFNTVVARTNRGWAPITLTPGSGAGYVATLSIQEVTEVRNIETITGGDSANTIYGAGGVAAGHVALIDAGAGDDDVLAGPDDFVYGNEGSDLIVGGSLVYGGNGDDELDGGTVQYGGSGNDVLRGGTFMAGGGGEDLLIGGEGLTTFHVNPADLGTAWIEDHGSIDIDTINAWYFESIGLIFDDGAPSGMDGLWVVSGGTQFRLEGELYWDDEEYPDHESEALTIPYYGGEGLNFFYADLADLLSDLAAVGAPHRPEEIHLVPSFDDLEANDYAGLAPLYAAGLIEEDVVEFGSGVTLGDIALSWTVVDVEDPTTFRLVPHAVLELSWGPNQSIGVVVPRAADRIGSGVEQFRFADGTSLSMSEMIALAPTGQTLSPPVFAEGTALADALVGTRDAESFSGLEGDDLLLAGEGDDVLAGGDGADGLQGEGGSDTVFYEAAEVGIDQVIDAGIDTASYLDWYYADQGIQNWEQRPEYHSADQYRVYEGFGPYGGGGYAYFETFEAATAWSGGTRPVHYVAPPAVVAPFVGRDDKAALEQLVQAGAIDGDLVSFGPGLDVQDLDLTYYVLGPDAGAFPADPRHARGTLAVRWNDGLAGFDLEVPDVNYGFSGDSLINDAWQDYRLGEGVETFGFADGSTFGIGEILQLATVVVQDRYQFVRGSGSQVIDGNWAGVEFGADIAPSDLYGGREGSDLVFGVVADSALGRIPNWYADPAAIPNWSFYFSDGTVFDTDAITRLGIRLFGSPSADYLVADPLFASALYGFEGSDVLQGGDGGDLLDGGSGVDFLNGGRGRDIYVFDVGFGGDYVTDYLEEGGDGFDTVRFGLGIEPGEVTVEQNFEDLRVSLDSGDNFGIAAWFYEPNGAVERFEFADGTVWGATQIEAMLPAPNTPTSDRDVVFGRTGNDSLSGLEGDDDVYGYGGNDVLSGGPGEDFVEGGPGDDTYLFFQGDGSDGFWDRRGNDVIQLGAGIDPQDVLIARDPYSLLLLVGDQGDRIWVYDWFYDETNKIESVRFADGTTWDVAEIESRVTSAPATEFDDVLTGTAGNDRINGLGGYDEMYGLEGNDILEGGADDDGLDGGSGNNVLLGGSGIDYLYSSEPGVQMFVGGPDEDYNGADTDGALIAFNAGDGTDRVFVNPDQVFAISLGGASVSDLYLSRDQSEVLIHVGSQDSLRIGAYGWTSSIWPVGTLQIIGGDIRTYDLNAVVQAFVDAEAADPNLTTWSAEEALAANLVSTSTTHAIGGAIAYEYATTGGVAGLTTAQMQAVLAEAEFGFVPQPISVPSGNASPQVDTPIVDQSANEDASFSFAIPASTFSDPDAGDVLTYAASLDDGSTLPGWLTFDAQTQTFSGAPLQADVGAIDIKVTATDGGGLFVEDTFTLTVENVNDVPVMSATNSELLLNDSTLASTLFSVFDEDGQSPTQYEFWDDVAGGGRFTLSGVDQGASAAIPVSATDLANMQYVAGATPGTERVWVRAFDGAAWSAWQSWNMTSALHIPNAAPEATPTGATQTVLFDQAVAASTLFSVLDADGDPAVRYEFWDSTAGNGYFAVNGVEQAVDTAIVVAAEDLADTTFVGGSSAGSDTVWVRATDGQTFGAWKSWTMNSWPHATNAAPVANAPNSEVLRNQAVLAQSLFTVMDADGDAITEYEFWDDTAGGGYFSISGVEQSNNPIPVSAEQLADVEYVGGAEVGTEQVWVRASDGLQWGAWESWNMTTALHIPNAAPEATPTAATQTVLLGQAVDASSLFSVTDGDGDPAVLYEFFDSTAGNGHFTVNGVEQGVNVGISVGAADLANTQFVGSATTGADTVWVRASDGQSFGAWKSWTMNSWPHVTNAAPVAEAANATVITGEALAASALFTVTDADGDAAVRYEFWDDVNGGGYWRVNGMQQAAAAAIAVDAADLANTEYVGGANTGSEQIWVRVNDGMQWGAWESWIMNSWPHLTNAAPVVTASNATVLLDQGVAASSLFSVTDGDGDAIAQYEFWDSTAGNGHFTVSGVEQGVNVAIGVAAAQLGDTAFVGGSATGSDTVWVRAHDGMAWSAWKSWTMNSWPHATNAAPTVSAAHAGILTDEALSASMFFAVTDADGDAPVQYEFWDDVNGGGYWSLEGVQQASGQAIPVTAAQLAELDYVGGANPGTEQVWVRASDGMGWSAWKNWLMSTEGGMLRGGEGPDTLNGTAGPTVLQGGGGNDTLTDTDGDNLFSGGEGDDTMTGGDGDDLFAGGAGNDVVNTGAGSNIIAYNAGGGIDTVYAAAGATNTLSFGGGIGYDDLSLSRDGNDLIVSAGANDQVVLKEWYAGSQSVLNLQIILDASDDFDANSSDPLYNKKVQTFDFLGMVSEFDDALAQSPGLTSWAVTNALLAFHLSGADDAAIGGDLAYWYGKNNGFTGISLAAAQQVIGAAGFGSDAQSLQPFSGLQEGYVKLA